MVSTKPFYFITIKLHSVKDSVGPDYLATVLPTIHSSRACLTDPNSKSHSVF